MVHGTSAEDSAFDSAAEAVALEIIVARGPLDIGEASCLLLAFEIREPFS